MAEKYTEIDVCVHVSRHASTLGSTAICINKNTIAYIHAYSSNKVHTHAHTHREGGG